MKAILHKSHGLAVAMIGASVIMLGGCDSGPGADAYGGGARGAMIAKCVPRLERQAPSPAIAEAVCGCIADRFTAAGMSPTDMFTGGRDQMLEFGRQCAAANGLPVQG
jgi:hypothetical protein